MLADLFGSRVRAKVVAWLFSHPRQRYFVRQLHGLLSEDATHVGRELGRLAGLGLLTCQTEGQQKYYQANRRCPFFAELAGLATKAMRLGAGLAGALERHEGVSAVLSALGEGTPGQSDRAVVVIIIGDSAFAEGALPMDAPWQRPARRVRAAVQPGRLDRAAVAGRLPAAAVSGPRVFLTGQTSTGLGQWLVGGLSTGQQARQLPERALLGVADRDLEETPA